MSTSLLFDFNLINHITLRIFQMIIAQYMLLLILFRFIKSINMESRIWTEQVKSSSQFSRIKFQNRLFQIKTILNGVPSQKFWKINSKYTVILQNSVNKDGKMILILQTICSNGVFKNNKNFFIFIIFQVINGRKFHNISVGDLTTALRIIFILRQGRRFVESIDILVKEKKDQRQNHLKILQWEKLSVQLKMVQKKILKIDRIVKKKQIKNYMLVAFNQKIGCQFMVENYKNKFIKSRKLKTQQRISLQQTKVINARKSKENLEEEFIQIKLNLKKVYPFLALLSKRKIKKIHLKDVNYNNRVHNSRFKLKKRKKIQNNNINPFYNRLCQLQEYFQIQAIYITLCKMEIILCRMINQFIFFLGCIITNIQMQLKKKTQKVALIIQWFDQKQKMICDM